MSREIGRESVLLFVGKVDIERLAMAFRESKIPMGFPRQNECLQMIKKKAVLRFLQLRCWTEA
jgi:hypothetical protein